MTFLEQVPDPRRVNRSYPLPALLALSVCAMLCGARSLYAIAQWGRDHGDEIAHALGFRRERTPCVATLHYLFRKLDAAAFERALTAWAAQGAPPRQAVALDGKTLRGVHGEQVPGVHLLALFSHGLGLVLSQQAVPQKAGELTGARQLLAALDLHGLVLTGDAMFTQRDVCATIAQKGATGC